MLELRAFPKINVFLKVLGFNDALMRHALYSRFCLVENGVFDNILVRFGTDSKRGDGVKISGDFGCEIEQNSIKKVLDSLAEFVADPAIKNELSNIEIEVEKNIPKGAGLGGGSSDAAAVLMAIDRYFKLNLSLESLLKISKSAGEDTGFFVFTAFYKTNAAELKNNKFYALDSTLNDTKFEIFTPEIHCNTAAVYKKFRALILEKSTNYFSDCAFFETQKNSEILRQNSREFLNDLWNPSAILYPNLRDFAQENYFFSGSGSSFFRVKNG